MDIICVTQRTLCTDFLLQLDKIGAAKPKFIILREKDLSEKEYKGLALKALEICRRHRVPMACNSFYKVAAEIGAEGIHLPLALAETISLSPYKNVGISVHSPDEALRAQELGADYIVYGHIFATDCKKGLPPRGTEQLRKICHSLTIPTYAIGGITPQNYKEVINAGARGICLMSSLMKTQSPKKLIKEFD